MERLQEKINIWFAKMEITVCVYLIVATVA